MRRKIALVLATFQAVDLVVTQISPRYGDDHLDHLGVPSWLRSALPPIKAVAVVALLSCAKRRRARSVVGVALVPYYSAAAMFHVLSGDRPADIAPAVACGCLAAAIV